MDVSERFVASAPSVQNVVDIFENEWSSKLPDHVQAVTLPGHAPLFEDVRITWADTTIGPFRDLDVLELGPLEGAHSTMLERLGAASVTSVEANARAFLKCLCIKEVMGLTRVRFLLGDFLLYLRDCRRFDAIVCSGVLYHMTDPLELLRLVMAKTDRILVWSHYFDADVISRREDKDLFAEAANVGQSSYRGSRRLYPEAALTWSGFSGGAGSHAIWLEKSSLLKVFSDQGFRTTVEFDQPYHPNGPALAVCATRVHSSG